MSKHLLYSILPLLIIAEVCFNVVFNKDMLGQTINATGQFLVSIAFGILVVVNSYKRIIDEKSERVLPGWKRPAVMSLSIVLIIIFCLNLHGSLRDNPINVKDSDIIPLIQVAVQRFLTGQYPYAPVDFPGYSLPLTYLPAQWLPFCFAAIAGFDYRWIAIILNALAALWLIRRSQKNSYLNGLLIIGLLIFNYTITRKFEESIFINTVELLIAGYYMALIAGLGSKNAIIKGIVISLCLMSRYSLILWLPLWFMVEFISGNKRHLGITTITIIVAVLVIYVIPFLSHDWGIFAKGYDYYTKATIAEWQHLNPDNKPAHLYSGHGFAWLFYEKLSNYSIEYRLKALQLTHFLLSFGSVIVMGIWYWFNRRKINHKLFLLGSFKIYLSIFLAFIQVPYVYLMITGSFVSIAILAELMRYKMLPAASEPIAS